MTAIIDGVIVQGSVEDINQLIELRNQPLKQQTEEQTDNRCQ